jgi:hypothetical protein
LLIDIISNLNVKSIGGLELGAIPIAVAIAMKSYDHPTTKNLKAFIVRKSAKKMVFLIYIQLLKLKLIYRGQFPRLKQLYYLD